MAVLRAAWALGNKQDCSSSTHLRCRMLFHVLLSPPKPLEGKTKQNKNQKRWLELVMQCHKQGWDFFVPRKHQSMWMQIRRFVYSWDVICYWPWSQGQPLEPPLRSQTPGPWACHRWRIIHCSLGWLLLPSWWQTAAVFLSYCSASRETFVFCSWSDS